MFLKWIISPYFNEDIQLVIIKTDLSVHFPIFILDYQKLTKKQKKQQRFTCLISMQKYKAKKTWDTINSQDKNKKQQISKN